MPHDRKFRFGIQTARAKSRQEWVERARKAEDLGYSSLFVPDHFDDQLAPLPAMMAAAEATTTLRVGSLVFDNDYKHPVVLHKEAATMDLLSDGRLELGIGAGWMRSDYDQAGMPFESPGVRIERLKESLAILKGLFGDGPVTHNGKHYTITGLEGTPKPVQKPHPPILVGGGGLRMMGVAAREADIVGINFTLPNGVVDRVAMESGGADATKQKIEWLRRAAGERFGELELNITIFAPIVTDDRKAMAERIGAGGGMGVEDTLAVPHFLIGTVDQIADDLRQRREEYGFSYIVISRDAYEPLEPVVNKLAGT